MNQNCIENIPLLLFFIDIAFLVAAIPIIAIIGSDSLLAASTIPVIAYSLGAYDLLTPSRRRRLNAHHYATLTTCVCFILYEVLFGDDVFSPSSTGLIALFVGVFVGFSIIRRFIAKAVLSGVQSVVLHLPRVLESVANTFNSFIESAAYPARVELGADTPTVTI